MTENERRSLPIWKRIISLIFTLLIFAIQVALIVLIVYSYIYATITYIVVYIVAAILAIYIFQKSMSTNYKLTWITLILALPVIFIVLYLMNSTSRRLSKRKRTKIRNNNILKYYTPNTEILKDEDKVAYNLANIVSKDTYAPVYNDSKFIFFDDCHKKLLDMAEELKKG